MSRIDELIADRCPNGVPYRAVTELADYVRGVTYNKNDEQTDGPIGVLRANNITLATKTLNFTDVKRVSDAVRVRTNQRLLSGDILICAGSGSRDHIGKVAYVEQDLAETFGGFMAVVRGKGDVESRFLFHLLTGGSFSHYLQSALSTTTINNLNAGIMRVFRIPVPPLEVQREIVRILDQFTQLEAELEAELEARRRQFEHYRHVLLSDGSGKARMLPLGDIFEMRAGIHINASEIAGEPTAATPYPCFGGNGLRGYVGSYNYDEEVILVGRQGALCGNVHRAAGKIYATEHAVVATPKVPVDMSWAYHKLTQVDLNQFKTQSAQPGLAVGRIKEVEVNYTPIEDQRRNGTVLDHFDTLVSDLSIGLPAELVARRKQYEYYRDKLLTFKEAV